MFTHPITTDVIRRQHRDRLMESATRHRRIFGGRRDAGSAATTSLADVVTLPARADRTSPAAAGSPDPRRDHERRPGLPAGARSACGTLDAVLHGRSGLSPVMVGRSTALQRLLGLIDSAEVAALDAPEIALVSGEAGIGKTRLLRELLERLPADVTVLGAQAQPGSLGRAFDVIGQLAAPGTDPATGASAAIEAAVATGRTVLVVEDLHWADADSAHLIEHLAVRPWPQLVVIGTYRATDLSPKAPGGELVLRLERQSSVEQIRLERLDRTEVASMLGAIGGRAPSSAAVEAVYRRSGGIPFVVEELMRGVGPDLCSDDFLTAQLPWSLDEAVRQQLAGLERAERAVVDALAVFGEPASFDMLGALTELDEGDLLDALSALDTGERARRVDERPLLVRARARRRRRRPAAARPPAPAAARARARGVAGRAGRRPCLAGPSRRRRRALRAGRADRPRRRPAATSTAVPRSRRCAWPATRSRRSPTTSSCCASPPMPRGAWTSSPRR